MCFKPKRDPRIEEEQRRQREAAEAAKEAARLEQEANRQKQLEAEKEAKATAAATEAANRAKEQRQAEMASSIPVTPAPRPVAAPRITGSLVTSVSAPERAATPAPAPEPETVRTKVDETTPRVTGSEMTATGLKAPTAPKALSAAALRRRTTRSGRGRRSLLTSSSGGMGYFSRFL